MVRELCPGRSGPLGSVRGGTYGRRKSPLSEHLSERNPATNLKKIGYGPHRRGCGLKCMTSDFHKIQAPHSRSETNRASAASAFVCVGSAKRKSGDSVVRVAVVCIQTSFRATPFGSAIVSPGARPPQAPGRERAKIQFPNQRALLERLGSARAVPSPASHPHARRRVKKYRARPRCPLLPPKTRARVV